MDIGITAAQRRLPHLVRAVQRGERVIITRRGTPVAELAAVPLAATPPSKREIQWGWAKGEYEIPADFDAPMDEDEFCGDQD